VSTISLVDLPDRIDAKILAGRPFRMRVPIYDPDGDLVAAVDMSVARAQVRQAIGDPSPLHIFSSEDAEPDALIVDGAVILVATSETTSSWQENWPGSAPETVAWWDLEVTDADGTPRQVNVPGTITVVHQVTR
jgi:hypothetical protein